MEKIFGFESEIPIFAKEQIKSVFVIILYPK